MNVTIKTIFTALAAFGLAFIAAAYVSGGTPGYDAGDATPGSECGEPGVGYDRASRGFTFRAGGEAPGSTSAFVADDGAWTQCVIEMPCPAVTGPHQWTGPSGYACMSGNALPGGKLGQTVKQMGYRYRNGMLRIGTRKLICTESGWQTVKSRC